MAAEVLRRLTYTPEEVAQMLGVSLTAVYEWLRSGRMPGFKVGGRWLVAADLLPVWVEERARANWRQAPPALAAD